jgi:hypothetical protein
MTTEREDLIAGAIGSAEEPKSLDAGSPPQRPRLLIENCDPHLTVAALRDILSGAGRLYDRGVPVSLAFDQMQGGTVARLMTPDALVLLARIIQPIDPLVAQTGVLA